MLFGKELGSWGEGGAGGGHGPSEAVGNGGLDGGQGIRASVPGSPPGPGRAEGRTEAASDTTGAYKPKAAQGRGPGARGGVATPPLTPSRLPTP